MIGKDKRVKKKTTKSKEQNWKKEKKWTKNTITALFRTEVNCCIGFPLMQSLAVEKKVNRQQNVTLVCRK